MNTNQLFSESKEIEDNYELADRFLHELYEHRILIINNIKYIILQCGEINILRVLSLNLITSGGRGIINSMHFLHKRGRKKSPVIFVCISLIVQALF